MFDMPDFGESGLFEEDFEGLVSPPSPDTVLRRQLSPQSPTSLPPTPEWYQQVQGQAPPRQKSDWRLMVAPLSGKKMKLARKTAPPGLPQISERPPLVSITIVFLNYFFSSTSGS